MPAAYYYWGLLAAGVTLFISALLYRRDWKLLVLHLSIFSIIHPFEAVVMSTQGYVYKPGIVTVPAGVDNLLGAFISDFFVVPASAVFIQAFTLSWGPILCISIVFTGIDYFFMALGIFQHLWWKSIYTGLGLIILYAVSRRIWTGLKERDQSLPFRLLIIHLTYFALQSILFFAVNRGGRLFSMYVPFLDFLPEPRLVPASVYQLIISITVMICIGLKMPWRYRVLGIGVIVALNWAIGYFGVFVPIVSITPQYLILGPIGALALLIALFRAAKLGYLFP